MPSKFRLRYLFRPLVNLIAKGLLRIRFTPNATTVIMLCFSIISFISLGIYHSLPYFSIFVFITGIMDGCDGAIARLTNRSTKFGGFFDSFMDRISEFFIFLGLYFYIQNQLLWNILDMKLVILISFTASIMISYTRARAEVFFKGDFDVGLMARSERLFYLVIISLISLFYNLFNLFLFIFMLLVLGTFVYRLINIYYKIKKKE
ncbi:MAG: CDP-alcohol phosphatidyltransferase family protein [Candidatus Hermodarchaeota archaeon]